MLLDQLSTSNYPSNLRWLPSLPTNVKLILSVIPSLHLESLKKRLSSETLFEILPMQVSDAEELLDDLLEDAKRTLTAAQRHEVLDKFSLNGLPLYLKLAFEEAKLWHSYTTDFALMTDVPSLLRDNLFARLSHNAEHGERLVSQSLAYIQASRNGLLEEEILEILFRDEVFWADFEARTHEVQRAALQFVKQLPIAVWSRLYFDLEPYLIERGEYGFSLLSFYHRQFSEIVNTLYLVPERENFHTNLANYFKAQSEYTARKVTEQAYQQAKAKLQEDYVATLTDYHYLQTSLDFRGVQALIEDCGLWKQDTIELIQTVLSISAHIINQDKASFAHQLVGRLMGHRQSNEAIKKLTNWIVANVEGIYPNNLDGQYHVLNQPGGALIRTLSGHKDMVDSAMFSPDGQYIVSTSWDNTVRIWVTATGELLKILEHTSRVHSANFSPDGQYIVSSSADKKIRIWDISTGELLKILEGHSDRVTSVSFSPDGQCIVSSSDDKTIKIWKFLTGELLTTLEKHKRGVDKASFSPDGKLIVSASPDKTVRIWDAVTGELLKTIHLKSMVRTACFSPDGQTIVSASSDQILRIWETRTGKLIRTLEGHLGDIFCVTYSPDGKYIASAGTDHTVRIWDAVDGRQLKTLKGHAGQLFSIAYSPDGRFIVSASSDKAVFIWDVVGHTSSNIEGLTKHTGLVYSPNGRFVVSASSDKTMQVWDVASGNPILSLEGHTKCVKWASFSPDGKYIVSASWDMSVRIWDAIRGTELKKLEGHSNHVYSASFSPDGKYIASASADKTIRIWNVDSGVSIKVLDGSDSSFNSVMYSDDGDLLVASSGETLGATDYNSIWVWDARSFVLLAKLEGHTEMVNRAMINKTGHRIASSSGALVYSQDNTIRIWDARNFALLAKLEGHGEMVNCSVFSPDNAFILSASSDRTLKIWDLQSSKCIYTFYSDANFESCAWSPDGNGLVAGDSLGRVLFLRSPFVKPPCLGAIKSGKFSD